MRKFNKLGVFLFTTFLVSTSLRGADDSATAVPNKDKLKLETPAPTLWEAAVGEGFRSSAQTLALEAGAFKGFPVLGGTQSHDLALLSFSYGHMLGHTVGQGHFYKGNLELRGELLGGVEFSPGSEWFLGVAPHLRYNFATGTRFVPYVDAGAGVTATSIGPPDLSNTFEFNLQAIFGTHIFLRDNLALTFEARYLHLSCAGISSPNHGLNGAGGMAGLTFFF